MFEKVKKSPFFWLGKSTVKIVNPTWRIEVFIKNKGKLLDENQVLEAIVEGNRALYNSLNNEPITLPKDKLSKLITIAVKSHLEKDYDYDVDVLCYVETKISVLKENV